MVQMCDEMLNVRFTTYFSLDYPFNSYYEPYQHNHVQ
jgi:hypothetical protein